MLLDGSGGITIRPTSTPWVRKLALAFQELLRRFPDYDVDERRVVRAYGSNFRGLASLRIVFEPMAAAR